MIEMCYKGKGDPVGVHPAKIDEMKEKGWQEKAVTKTSNKGAK